MLKRVILAVLILAAFGGGARLMAEGGNGIPPCCHMQ